MKKTRTLMKINANALLSGNVHEHTLNCQCGAPINVQGTRTGRISARLEHKSNVPKPSKLSSYGKRK